MKAFIIPVLALIINLIPTIFISKLITRKRRKEGRLSRKRLTVTFIIVLIILYPLGGFIYFNTYSRAKDEAKKCMEGNDKVKVESVDTGYLFDGPGIEDALIFYPGAMVDEKAYAPLMLSIAEQGIDCFIVKMPLHMAFMGRGKADDVIGAYKYNHYYISGHSLGGAMAGVYMKENAQKLSGAVLMCAYSEEEIPEGLPTLSIIADKDEVMDRENYDEWKKGWPSDVKEVNIAGGNHGQFGDYGSQRGDGEATISRDEQTKQVADAVTEFIKSTHQSQ